MAWGFIMEFPVPAEEYDRLDREVGPNPEGLIVHIAAKSGDGMKIIDVWESKEAFERFERNVIMPAAEQAGMAPPEGGGGSPARGIRRAQPSEVGRGELREQQVDDDSPLVAVERAAVTLRLERIGREYRTLKQNGSRPRSTRHAALRNQIVTLTKPRM